MVMHIVVLFYAMQWTVSFQ